MCVKRNCFETKVIFYTSYENTTMMNKRIIVYKNAEHLDQYMFEPIERVINVSMIVIYRVLTTFSLN